MRQKQVTISIDEYEHLKNMENLTHKQRFRIANLEKEFEIYKVKASVFSKKTLDILLGSGYTFEQILLLYGNHRKDNICQH